MRFVRPHDDCDDDDDDDDALADAGYDAGYDEGLLMLLSRRNAFSAAFVAVAQYCAVGWRMHSAGDDDVPSRKRVPAVGVRFQWLADCVECQVAK